MSQETKPIDLTLVAHLLDLCRELTTHALAILEPSDAALKYAIKRAKERHDKEAAESLLQTLLTVAAAGGRLEDAARRWHSLDAQFRAGRAIAQAERPDNNGG